MTTSSGSGPCEACLKAYSARSEIYGLYTGFVYLTPLFGGGLADHVLGQRRTVILGAALMAIGHFMMAFEPLFLLALFTLILGNGAFKPNISTQVGGLYAPGDHRRDRAYSIFYVGINVGAFLAPLICGTLGEELGWHYGFAAAGVGMTIALAVYLYALPMLPPDEMHKAKAAGLDKKPLDRNEWRAILALIALFLPTTMFWATYEQQGNTIALWANDHTDRTIDLIVWHGEIPVTWFQAFNPFMIFTFTPFIIAFWAWQEKRGMEPSTVTKMALGCFCVALSYLIMAGAAWSAAGNSASWWWLFVYFVVITIGELYLSPIIKSIGGWSPPCSSHGLVVLEYRRKVLTVSHRLCCLKRCHDCRNPDFSIKLGLKIARSTRSGSGLRNALFGYHCSVHC
jgi:proton-dependent oligopeptide transporter, POT family